MAANRNESKRYESSSNLAGRNADRNEDRSSRSNLRDEDRVNFRDDLRGRQDLDRDYNQDWSRGERDQDIGRRFGPAHGIDRENAQGYARDYNRDFRDDYERNMNQGYYGTSYGRENREFGGDANRDLNRGYGSDATRWNTQGYGQAGTYGSTFGGNYNQGRANEGMTTSHVGKGPKGWKRSDDRIKDDVSEALERDPRIDASEIEVSVKGGIVTLSGSVDERRTKRMAEDVAETCAGVIDVRNELSINESLFQQAKEFFTGEESTSAKTSARSKSGRARH